MHLLILASYKTVKGNTNGKYAHFLFEKAWWGQVKNPQQPKRKKAWAIIHSEITSYTMNEWKDFFPFVGIPMTCHESTLRGWIWCDGWWSRAKDKDIIYFNLDMDETLKRD
jgi:hypothetical protein